MMEIAVLGSQEFILGFQLAGIRTVIETENDPTKQLADLMEDKSVGIIITDDDTLDKVNEQERYLAERSPNPLLIKLSKKSGEQSDLRKMIKQAIGVDILKEE